MSRSPKKTSQKKESAVADSDDLLNDFDGGFKAETPISVSAPVAVASISEKDMSDIKLAEANMKLASLTAEKALSDKKAAEAEYKYNVLTLYMKYGLTAADAVDANGVIHRNANLPPVQG